MELENYKQQVKDTLEKLINEGNLEQANTIITNFEEIIKNDPDIISMKAIVNIALGNIEEAEEILWSAIRISIITPDILYNLAYIYQCKGDHEKAYKLYSDAVIRTSDINLKMEIEDIINKLQKDESPYKYRFSIVIPTRNSTDTLKYTLQTCLEQEYDSYEIIVSDNSSDGNHTTKELIETINDNKIKYFKPTKELAMTENFEFAVSKATGEYIIVLGSDDALLLHALPSLDNTINNTGAKLLHWPQAAYGWPNVNLKGYENFFGTPLTKNGKINYEEIDSKAVIQKVIEFKSHYSSLPLLYCNSAVHRDLLKNLVEKTGSVFKGYVPDVYSGFVLAYSHGKFISIDVPMSIGGSSGNSNGIAIHHGNGKENKIKKDFIKLNKRAGLLRPKVIPNVKSLEAAIAESFLIAKDALFRNEEGLRLNRQLLITKCVEGLNSADEDFYEELMKIEESLEDSTRLKEWFKFNYLNGYNFYYNKDNYYRYNRGFNGGFLRVDASKFNVTNVFEASVLHRNLTGW